MGFYADYLAVAYVALVPAVPPGTKAKLGTGKRPRSAFIVVERERRRLLKLHELVTFSSRSRHFCLLEWGCSRLGEVDLMV